LASQCAGFLKETSNAPFFLYFASGDPHRSGQVLEDSPYKPDRFGNTDDGYEGILPTYYTPDKMVVPSYLPDSPECRAELAQYAQAVSRLDLGIGRLFELLRKEGLWEKTLIVYISDSGIAFPGAKTTLYDPGIHLPCIIKPPSAAFKGQTCDAMINWADITPTILDFCTAIPSGIKFQGRSFKQAMNEEHPAGWDQVFASHTFHEVTMYYPMRAIQNRQFKLIWNIAYPLSFPFSVDLETSATWQGFLKSKSSLYAGRNVQKFMHRPEFELYDEKEDPEERSDLSSNPQYAAVMEDMKVQLLAFLVRTNDPWILRWSAR
jgi:N-sulfoglucosamine sulfohydrolase